MNWAQFSIAVGIVAALMGIAVQLTRGIYKVAQVAENMKSMAEDMVEMKERIRTMDERIYSNAIRSTQRR